MFHREVKAVPVIIGALGTGTLPRSMTTVKVNGLIELINVKISKHKRSYVRFKLVLDFAIDSIDKINATNTKSATKCQFPRKSKRKNEENSHLYW